MTKTDEPVVYHTEGPVAWVTMKKDKPLVANVLLEGIPGVGKTMLLKTLSRVVDMPFSRIQFTPDLMPADITGASVLVPNADGRAHLEFRKGPIFSQLLLADEINRATPRTQSALLEAMHKPVDLIVLNTDEHVITDPRVRMAAQSGNVDWFRFWLQGYEDPDPAKTEQYARWRQLREMVSTRQGRDIGGVAP